MSVDEVVIQFNGNQVFLLNFCLAYIMFGVALELSLHDFTYILKNRKSTWAGLLSQLVALPLLTIVLIWIIKPYPSLALGMLLISVCPGGNVSNYAVHLAKGNTALSVVLTSISTLTSSLQTPFTFSLLYLFLPDEMKMESSEMSVPFFQMVETILILMILPLLLGMSVKQYFPALQSKILKSVKITSMLIFIGIIAGGIFSNWQNIHQHLGKVFFLVVIHNSLALLIGFWIARSFGLPFKDKISISIETGIQNSGLALVLVFNFFDGIGGMALIAAWWSIWHLISAFSVAYFWRWKQSKTAKV
ncbi:MAG: bile acid:sodium symporter family protein [Saprospiraceae bacterium]|nr:bile acid:sodium symporter family protein [Saprospiraceae bacterium]MBK7524980.1 bile acid:sodium symporter family protein [Saprospiraceae bacterium]MBK9042802.1 bile acid:sodium symporter family protein [Saprospiraceae bacterium]